MEDELDVDRWCTTMYPHQLLETIGRPSTSFVLANHAPQIQDNPKYKDWMYVARSSLYLLVPPSHKAYIIRQLHNRLFVILASKCPRTLTQGQHTITLSMLVEVLEESHCHSVRVQAHGMKHPLQVEHSLQVDAPHPLDKTNLYDIGRTVEAKEIYTFKPKAGKTGMQVYEMFLPLGEGHGSIECIVQHEQQGLRVKIYPRYVHMIKAKGHQYSRMDPRTMGTAKTRLRAIEHFVSEMDQYHQLGGYRIEVSVRAAMLSEALSILEEKPLLTLDSWDEWLSVRCFTVGEVRGNVLRMLGHAWRQNILMGRDSKKTDELGKQVICDLGNAKGWSPGYRKPTLWSSELAWWREGEFETGDHAWDPEVEDEEMKELKPRHERVAKLGARNEMVVFFQSVRGGVPCCDCGAVNSYNLDGGKAQFRLG